MAVCITNKFNSELWGIGTNITQYVKTDQFSNSGLHLPGTFTIGPGL